MSVSTGKGFFGSLFETNEPSMRSSIESTTTKGSAHLQKAEEMQNGFIKGAKVIRSKLDQFKKTASLNRELTNNFIVNTNIIIDISKLLSEYNKMFEILGNIAKEYDGLDIKSEDMTHLSAITKEKMAILQETFNKQTSNVQKLFKDLSMNTQVDQIDKAKEQMASIERTASDLVKPAEGGNKWPIIGGKKNTLSNEIKKMAKRVKSKKAHKKKSS